MNIHALIARENRERRGQNGLEMPEKRVILGAEKRFFPTEISLRASKKGSGPGQIFGKAAVYNQLSVDLGGFMEKLLPGCFNDVMKDDCRALFNHDDNQILGRTSAGTLDLFDEDDCLRFEVDLPDTQTGRDVAENIKLRNITGCSFQFSVAMDGADWNWDAAMPLRIVKRIGRLYDVGPVTFPAYESTEVDARSFRAALESRKEFEAEQVRRSLSLAKARLRLAEASYL